MAEWTERAELLFKKEGLDKLKNANILIIGLGGVGSFAAEFITRAGVGKMTIVDGDVVDITNINRQLPEVPLLVNPEIKLFERPEALGVHQAVIGNPFSDTQVVQS